MTYTVELPLGTTGAVISPDGTTHEVGSGAHKIQWTNPRSKHQTGQSRALREMPTGSMSPEGSSPQRNAAASA